MAYPPKPKKKPGESQASYSDRVFSWELNKPVPGSKNPKPKTGKAKTAVGPLPKGYKPPGPAVPNWEQYAAGAHESKVRYFTGAPQEILGSKGPQQVAEIQQALWRLGLLSKEAITGVVNGPTKTAFAIVLGNANTTGQHWELWMSDAITAADEMGYDPNAASAQARAPLTIELTSPEDIKGGFDKVSPETIGRGLTPQELDAQVQRVQAGETQEQTDRYNQGETGGTLTKTPTSDGLIRQLEKEHPQEYKATQMGEKAKEIYDMLTNGTQLRAD